MQKFVFAILALAFVACTHGDPCLDDTKLIVGCPLQMDGTPGGAATKSGEVEVVRADMVNACSLAVNRGFIAWVDVANGDVYMHCQGYGGPIYVMYVNDPTRQARVLGRGTNPAINDDGHLGYVELDQENRCARARINGAGGNREIANNCDTFQGNPHYGSTSFSGDNFVFTLQKDQSSSRLYHYNGREVRKTNRYASFARVVGDEIGFVDGLQDQNNTPYFRGRIENFNGDSVEDFGYGNGIFQFTKKWVIYVAYEDHDNSNLYRGYAYLMNRATKHGYQMGHADRVAINKESTHIAWQNEEGLHVARIGSPGVTTIIGGREAVFDGNWLYYIEPDGDGETLFRMFL